tara:strand:+ start:7733 stop:8077 length:345 start_codon:yes stop_codon:yes gene_type:complete
MTTYKSNVNTNKQPSVYDYGFQLKCGEKLVIGDFIVVVSKTNKFSIAILSNRTKSFIKLDDYDPLLVKIRSEFGILKTSSWKSNFYPWSRNNNGDFFVWNTPNHQKVINILRGQ